MADAKAIKQSARVALDNQASIVVVSATSGTTDELLQLSREARDLDIKDLLNKVEVIGQRHLQIAADIGGPYDAGTQIKIILRKLKQLAEKTHKEKHKSRKITDSFLCIGEQLSSILMLAAFSKLQPDTALIKDARDFIKTDSHFSRANPDLAMIKAAVEENLLPLIKAGKIVVTQGYIGQDSEGTTTTLGRGGSDYTAALLAEAVNADLLQIWTDVKGIATTDPRIASAAQHIGELTFQEAAELATAGAKILYPKTIIPTRRANIPVYVGNTFNPEAQGTIIHESAAEQPLVRAIAIKKDQRLITLTTIEMAQQFGFLAKLFDIFARYKVSVDQVSTSEISVAVTMDSLTLSTDNLLLELQELGKVSIEENISAITLIGNNINKEPGLAGRIFSSLETKDSKIAIRMICQGASKHSFCFLVADKYGEQSVKKLHKQFIEEKS